MFDRGRQRLPFDLREVRTALYERLVENHATYTDSDRAAELLANWGAVLSQFVKVMPEAYEQAVTEEGREDVRNSPPPKASVHENGEGVAAKGGAD